MFYVNFNLIKLFAIAQICTVMIQWILEIS